MSKDHNHGEPMSTRVVWRDAPEFLPVDRYEFRRVSSIDRVALGDTVISVESEIKSGSAFSGANVRAPYFAAWLDRLGIPWTEELRRAHDAAKEGGAT
jgi:hypothetical protein